jgi:hypothetical protein
MHKNLLVFVYFSLFLPRAHRCRESYVLRLRGDKSLTTTRWAAFYYSLLLVFRGLISVRESHFKVHCNTFHCHWHVVVVVYFQATLIDCYMFFSLKHVPPLSLHLSNIQSQCDALNNWPFVVTISSNIHMHMHLPTLLVPLITGACRHCRRRCPVKCDRVSYSKIMYNYMILI